MANNVLVAIEVTYKSGKVTSDFYSFYTLVAHLESMLIDFNSNVLDKTIEIDFQESEGLCHYKVEDLCSYPFVSQKNIK